ncbi:gp58-like family protein [Leuconostoc gelidum]|uniref:gp58-like family protein n=1 Tax=Leuconostoc gelidum TaxID=1244 RepID=UPI001CC583BE|nr:gp58-like family protein [Leuconostoc gelidum]
MKYKKTIITITAVAAISFGTGAALARGLGHPIWPTRSIIDQLGDKLTTQSATISTLSQLTDATGNLMSLQNQVANLQSQLTNDNAAFQTQLQQKIDEINQKIAEGN